MLRRILIISGVLMALVLGLFLASLRNQSPPMAQRGGFFTTSADGRGVDWNVNYDVEPKP